MRFFLLINLLILVLPIQAQEKDQVDEILDSLQKIYGYEKIEYSKTNKYNFKTNEIPVYSESVYKDRIEVLNKFTPFKFTYNSIVRKYIDRYAKYPKSVSYILTKTQLYFPLFEKYLNQFSLPLELKNLAIVESALNPTAKSHCGAAGLWQFMYGTGKSYKLEINSTIDERFDPEKETIVACMYLSDLYKKYQDWPLVLAAYNCGPGNVNKAIKKAGKSDFWAIYEYLPKETQGYVPAFIAASYITTFHQEHNIMASTSTFLYEELDFILINQKTTLKEIAQKSGIELKKLQYLNPKYFINIVPGFNDKVIVPLNVSLAWIDNGTLKTKNTTVKEANEVKTTVAKDQMEQNSTINNLPDKKNSPFGTVYKNNEKKPTVENSQAFLNSVQASTTIYAETYSNYILTEQSVIKLRLTDSYTVGGVLINRNSILIGKAYMLKSSVFIKISSIQTTNSIIPIDLEGEVYEKPIKGKLQIEEGYTIMFKN